MLNCQYANETLKSHVTTLMNMHGWPADLSGWDRGHKRWDIRNKGQRPHETWMDRKYTFFLSPLHTHTNIGKQNKMTKLLISPSTPSCPTLSLSLFLSRCSVPHCTVRVDVSELETQKQRGWHLPHCSPPSLCFIVFPPPPLLNLCKEKEYLWGWTLLLGPLNTGMSQIWIFF